MPKRRSKSSKNSERLILFLFVILAFGIFSSAEPQVVDPIVSPTPTPTPYHGGGGGGGSTDPTPTPTTAPTVTGTNLAPMFQYGTGQNDGCKWGDYHLYGDVYYGAITNPQLCHRDDTVLSPSGHSSIRVDGPPTVYNGAREVNQQWNRVYAGDRVVFKMWVKTNPSTIGPGAIIGFDCFGAYDRILEVTKRVPDQTAIWNVVNGVPTQGGTAVYVPYGSDWTQITIDVTIPDYTYTYADGGGLLPHGAQQIVGIAPWVTGSWNYGETASVWFADAELYINPS